MAGGGVPGMPFPGSCDSGIFPDFRLFADVNVASSGNLGGSGGGSIIGPPGSAVPSGLDLAMSS